MIVVIEFDCKKRKENLAKHCLDFKDAELFDWDNADEYDDNRKDYGEFRVIAFGDFKGRLTVMVYTQREEKVRLISWRKANKREVEEYG